MMKILGGFVSLCLVVLMLVSIQFRLPSQTNVSPMNQVEAITADNASQLQQLQMLGRGGINDMIWNPQGSLLAILGPNGIWVYDAQNWAAEPIHLGNSYDRAWSGVFTTEGDKLITTYTDGWRIWDLSSHSVVLSVPNTLRAIGIVEMEISPDGATLATVGSHYTHRTVSAGLQLWDLKTGLELGYAGIADVGFESVSFSPDGKNLLVLGSHTASFYVYNVATLVSQNDNVLPSEETPIQYEALDAAYAENGQAYILYKNSLAEQQQEFILQSYPDNTSRIVTSRGGWYYITTLDLNLNAGLLAASGEMGRIEVYDVASGELRITLGGHTRTYQVSIDPSGQHVVSYGHDQLLVWNLATGESELITDLHTMFGYTVEWFSTNSNRLAFGTQVNEGEIQIWDLDENRVVERIQGHGGWTTSIIFNSNDTFLAFGSGFGCCATLYSLENHQDIMYFQHESNGAYTGVQDVFFTENHDLLLTSGSDGTVKLWQIDTGVELASFGSGGRFRFQQAGISSSGEYLFTRTDSGIQMWNVETAENFSTLNLNYGNMVLSDDATLFVFSDYNTVNIWNADTLQPLVSAEGTVISDLAFSPDNGLLAATTFGGDLIIFDVMTGIRVYEQNIVDWKLTSVDWNADQTKIAVTGSEGSIQILGVPNSED